MSANREQIAFHLPATVLQLAKKTNIEVKFIKNILSNARDDGYAEIVPGTRRVWQLTAKGKGVYKEALLELQRQKAVDQNKPPKRKYTRKKKPKRAGILLRIEMMETRLQNLEDLLGVDQI